MSDDVLEFWLGDKPATLTADYSLRFVEVPNADRPEPVLYYQGRRVTQEWGLYLAARRPPDPHGDNANTAEIPRANSQARPLTETLADEPQGGP